LSTNIVIYDKNKIYWWYKVLKNDIFISCSQLSWSSNNILTYAINSGKEIVFNNLEMDTKTTLMNIYPNSPFDWSFDGNNFIYIVFKKNSGQHLHVLNYETQISTCILTKYKKLIVAVKFSPDGLNIAIISWNGNIEIYNIVLQKWKILIVLFEIGIKSPRSLHWNSIGTIIRTPLKNSICGWYIKNGKIDYSIDAFEIVEKSFIEAIRISYCPDNKKVLYISTNGSIIIWDIINSKIIDSIIIKFMIESIIWSPTGDTIALFGKNSNKLQIWNTKMLNFRIKKEIHNSDYAMKSHSVVYSQGIDISKYK
jgi:WD40 repeat protein